MNIKVLGNQWKCWTASDLMSRYDDEGKEVNDVLMQTDTFIIKKSSYNFPQLIVSADVG